MDPIHEVLGRSAVVSLGATAIAVAIGVPLGSWLALARVRGRGLLAVFLNTGMAIPTVVVGLVVALFLWRSGPLGDLGLIYTLRGMMIAQVLIATPLIAGITMAGLLALPAELSDQLRALGANVGGNIHGQTQVMTTAIVEDVGRGNFNQALVYAAVLLALAFAINAVLTSVQQRAAAWAQS